MDGSFAASVKREDRKAQTPRFSEKRASDSEPERIMEQTPENPPENRRFLLEVEGSSLGSSERLPFLDTPISQLFKRTWQDKLSTFTRSTKS